MVFTFQSGYIQINTSLNCNINIISLYIPIWLYSNLYDLLVGFFPLPSLHSNLVIFKWYGRLVLVRGLYYFTFQSGYIQIIKLYVSRTRICYFTFQSGYIQISPSYRRFYPILSLHSNLVIFK